MKIDAVAQEGSLAEKHLESLVDEEIPAVQLNSIDASEAPFLGQVVSKLSPILGNLMENRVVNFLNENAQSGFNWIRQDPDFPDASLRHQDGQDTGLGFEIKAWYALSTELTGRFRESTNLLEKKNVKVVVIAWMMSHVIHGTPEILDILIVDAKKVAKDRDTHYFNPPDYLIVEPNDTSSRTANLRQTNVLGYKWQETDPKKLLDAHKFVEKSGVLSMAPNSSDAQKIVQQLMNRYSYRLDTNFAKIDRIQNLEIEAFKSSVLLKQRRGKTISDWTKLLSNLLSEDDSKKAKAEVEIATVYEEL